MTSKQLIEKYTLEDGIYKDYYEHFQSKKTVLTHRACEKIANIEGIIIKFLDRWNSSDNTRDRRHEDLIKEVNDLSDVVMEVKGAVSRINGRN